MGAMLLTLGVYISRTSWGTARNYYFLPWLVSLCQRDRCAGHTNNLDSLQITGELGELSRLGLPFS